MKRILISLFAWMMAVGTVDAAVSYERIVLDSGGKLLVVKGDFEISDDPISLSPRFAERAAPAAFCCAFDLAGMKSASYFSSELPPAVFGSRMRFVHQLAPDIERQHQSLSPT